MPYSKYSVLAAFVVAALIVVNVMLQRKYYQQMPYGAGLGWPVSATDL